MSVLKENPHLQKSIDRFWETIPPLWCLIKGRVRATATDSFGITVEQFHVLRHIRKGKKTVSELAEVKQISSSAISQVVDALVEKDLITRKASAEDRRRINLELTPAGDALLSAIFERNHEWMAAYLQNLSDEELETINRSMEILKNVFNDTLK
ncbi:MAG: MarR family transcriptional regulator [Anaerolineae bacterium]|nr:MarR family transcriptional regulator [Anaerolineae bacterium]